MCSNKSWVVIWGCGKTQKHWGWREPAKGQSYLHPALSGKRLALTLFPYPGEAAAVRRITQFTSVPFRGMLAYLARDHAKIIRDKVAESPPSANENTPKE